MANLQAQNHHQDKKTRIVLSDLENVTVSEDILTNIFTFLPIKNAIVASTVHPRFKHSWRQNRKFMFGTEVGFYYNQQNLAELINHLFDSHDGDEIKTFDLVIDPTGIEKLIRKWLSICTQKGIEDLDLYFLRSSFTIEFSVLNELHKLRTLKLINCEFEIFENLIALRFLQKLTLCKLCLTEEMFGVLMKHCKMLEFVDLCNVYAIKELKITADSKHFKMLRVNACQDLLVIEIDSPTIRSIWYHGSFHRIQFLQRQNLSEFFLYYSPNRNYIQIPQMESLVNDLSHVFVLTTTPQLIEALTARFRDGLFREAQYSFLNLRELQLFMEGGLFCNPYDISMFLKNCPSLVKLFINLQEHQFDCGVYWEMNQKHQLANFDFKFTQLRFVVLIGFRFLPSELELVKILFQRAIILELFVLVPSKIHNPSVFKREDMPKYQKCFSQWCASPRAKVYLVEKYDEAKFPTPTHPKSWFP